MSPIFQRVEYVDPISGRQCVCYSDGEALYASDDCVGDKLFTRDDYVGGDPEARAAWKAAGLD